MTNTYPFPRAFASGDVPPMQSPRDMTAATPGHMPTTPEAVEAARQRNYTAGVHDVLLRRGNDMAAMVEYWDLTDTIIDGIKALRLAGQAYLPRFTDEDDKAYQYRLSCTKMTNVYRDAVEGLASKPFEQEVELVEDDNRKVPDEIKEFAEDVDGSGNNLTVFSGSTFFNGINSAIHWIFVDSPPVDPTIRTVADQKRAGLRPYWSHVLGRNVLQATAKVINGDEALTYVRIFEPGSPDHIRIFERLDNGVIRWELREKREQWTPYGTGQTQFHEIGAGTLSIDVIPLVPFMTGRRDGRSFKLSPALRDAADLQIELYGDESALKFAKRLTGYPMLAGNGINPPKNPDGTAMKLVVGPSRVLYGGSDASGKQGSWAYVEPSATSLKFLADDIDATIRQLRELARQPLTAQSGNLTVITTAVAAGKAKSAVKAWAYTLKDALENAMVITCKFKNITPEAYDPVVGVYTEFDEFVDGKDLESLDADRDRGDISQETLWEEKKRRGVYGAEFTPDRERERLLKEVPADGPDNNPDDVPPTK